MRAMLDARHQFRFCGRVRPQLICDHDARSGTLALEQLAHQPKSCLPIPASLQQTIENVAVGINGAPQPVLPALDRHDHLIKVPFIRKITARPPTKLVGELQAKFRRPLRDCLKRDINAALGKQVFDVT